jgi:WD40 repeat protein
MGNKHYKAFISYSHKDEKFGKWLHKALEKYKIPKELRKDHPHLPKSLFPIFRDREELSTSSDLGTEILKALHHSEYLIIICSVHSAKSQWVNQEIIDFKAKHGEDKVHAIIIDGEPHAKDIDRFDDDLECFPEALKYKVIDGKLSDIPTEPIAGDFRKGKDGRENGKLKLISGLLGVGFDELNRREEKRKRRNRFVWGVVSISLIIVMAGLTIFSFIQRDRAIVSEKVALIEKSKAKEELVKANHNLGLTFFERSKQLLDEKDIEKTFFLLYNSLKLIKYKYDTDNSLSNIKNILLSRLNSIHRVFLTDANGTESILISADDKNIITVHKNYFEVRDIKNWNLLQKIEDKNRDENDSITCVALSKNNKYIVEGSWDGNIRIWNKITNKLERTFNAHNYFIKDLLVSNDSQYIISVSYNGVIKIGSLTETKLFKTLNKHINKKSKKMTDGVSKMAISPNNNYIVVGTNDKKMYIYDFRTKETKVSFIKTSGVVQHLKITPDSKKIIYATPAHTIKILDIESRKIVKILKGHKDKPINLTISSDGKEVISTSFYGVTRIWDINSGELKNLISTHPLDLKKYDNYDNLNSTLLWTDLAYSISNNKFIATTSNNSIIVSVGLFDNTIQIFERDTNIMSNFLKGDIYILNMNISPNGRNIVVGGINGKIQIWDLINKKNILEFQAHKWNVGKMIISDDNKRLISSGKIDGMIKIWDINHTTLIKSWKADENGISSIALSSNNKYLASVGFLSKDIKVWNIQNQKLMASFLGHNGSECIVFTPDNNNIVYVSEDEKIVNIEDIRNKKIIYKLEGHKGKITRILISPNKKNIITASTDMSIKIWNIKDGRLIRTIEKAHLYDVTDISISADNKFIISVSRNNIMKIWNIDNGKLIFKHLLVGAYNGQTHVRITSNNMIILSTAKGKYIEIIDKNFIDKLSNQKFISKQISLLEKELQVKLNGVKIENKRQYFNKVLWSREHPYFWLDKAQEGNVSAMYNLGLIYDKLKENDKAIYWYSKAIEKGDIQAKERLSILNTWLHSKVYVRKLFQKAIIDVKNREYINSKKNFIEAISIIPKLIENNESLDFLDKPIVELSKLYWYHQKYQFFYNFSKEITSLFEQETIKNREKILAYLYFNLGKIEFLNKLESLTHFHKSKENFEKILKKSSGFNAKIYLNIFQLSILLNEEFPKKIENEFIKKYKNHKDESIIYLYDLFKLLNSLSLKKEYDLEKFQKKHSLKSHYLTTFMLSQWIEKNSSLKKKLQKTLEDISFDYSNQSYIDLF